MRKPLNTYKLQDNIHISSIHLLRPTHNTDEMVSSISYKDTKPNSDDVRAAAAMCQYTYYALNNKQDPRAELLIDGWTPMEREDVEKDIGPGIYDRFKRVASGFNSIIAVF